MAAVPGMGSRRSPSGPSRRVVAAAQLDGGCVRLCLSGRLSSVAHLEVGRSGRTGWRTSSGRLVRRWLDMPTWTAPPVRHATAARRSHCASRQDTDTDDTPDPVPQIGAATEQATGTPTAGGSGTACGAWPADSPSRSRCSSRSPTHCHLCDTRHTQAPGDAMPGRSAT